jgi:hypothetical protein
MVGFPYELTGNGSVDSQYIPNITGNAGGFDQQLQCHNAPANNGWEVAQSINGNIGSPFPLDPPLHPQPALAVLNSAFVPPPGNIMNEKFPGNVRSTSTESDISVPNLFSPTSSHSSFKPEDAASITSSVGAKNNDEMPIDVDDDDYRTPQTSLETKASYAAAPSAATVKESGFPHTSGLFAYGKVGRAPPQPEGCTMEKCTGWDGMGLYYVGPHDRCPIWVVHRHHAGGFVQFDSVHDVIKIMSAPAAPFPTQSPSRPGSADPPDGTQSRQGSRPASRNTDSTIPEDQASEDEAE